MKGRKYKVVIVDDDNVAMDNLVWAINQHNHLEMSGNAINGTKGENLIMDVKPDLLFLDIMLPETSGFDLLHSIKERVTWNMQVVFYTAYDRYLLQALRESAFDFLLKPFQTDEINAILVRFEEKMESLSNHESFVDAVNKMPQTDAGLQKTFMVATVSGFRVLRMLEIGFFEYIKKTRQWEVHLFDSTIVRLRKHTTAEDIMVHSNFFLRISQSSIINCNYLSSIRGNECLFYPPFDDRALAISRSYLKDLRDHFLMM